MWNINIFINIICHNQEVTSSNCHWIKIFVIRWLINYLGGHNVFLKFLGGEALVLKTVGCAKDNTTKVNNDMNNKHTGW